jgi:hypothetical protein
MSRSASVLIYAEPQPSADVWGKAQELVERWNLEHDPKWEYLEAGEFSSYSLEIDADSAEFEDLENLLNSYREEHRLEFELHLGELVAEDDYESADFVLIYGQELHAQSLEYADESEGHGRFVVNEDENWERGEPCPGCGWTNEYGAQGGPIAVDEWYLDREYDPEKAAWEETRRDWDVISLPSGTILVSSRVADALTELGASGYEARNVVSATTGVASTRVFELHPERWIAQVCEEHTAIDGDVCPVCGRVVGKLEGHVHLRDEWVADDDVIGRNPGHRFVYLARYVFHHFREIEAKGMVAAAPLFVCAHEQ